MRDGGDVVAVLQQLADDPPRSDDDLVAFVAALTPHRALAPVSQVLAMLDQYSPAEPPTCLLRRDDVRAAARDALSALETPS